MSIDLGWLGSTDFGMDEIVMTEYGPMNLSKARTLSEIGELSLVPPQDWSYRDARDQVQHSSV